MTVIDSDAHVLETTRTWDFLEDHERQFRPMIVSQIGGDADTGLQGNAISEYWVVDGRLHDKERNLDSSTTIDSRELWDVSARLAHMDELEVDIQILYPTLFIRPYTARSEVEYALCRSYNRWLAEINAQAPNRLRWVVCPPLLSMDKVREELEFGKAHGACGIFVRAWEHDHLLTDSFMHPLYEMAGELDLPICQHAGLDSARLYEFYAGSPFNRFKLSGVGAFHHLLLTGTPAKFPKVRWGFIELSAQWVPYAINDLELKFKIFHRNDTVGNWLKDNNIWVACQTTDDLDKVLECTGEDNLVVGTDYGHYDTSTEIEALRTIRIDGKIPASICDKIMGDNACALYGL
ncbi:amidohydrolase [Alphaproteobacteria bacterium]|nr:amidohydrolase [Alphaproteobacteria bacterium]